ncbi:hypothetical protein [Candidatus Pantoea multigeneris]|uniref:Uncharacterized protein n=1 Tax=Candidatus Pantoea multigeneris TaxID=2608357 RepID=A0ABX0RK29_9GAMM|nr:hypothetical protein [Pantoea multigeneris]NIF23964.1 hypothetical protein [Pantoea multigeneris]
MSDVIAAAKGANDALGRILIWLPVISALAGGALTGGGALLVSRLNHHYARELVEEAAAERLRNETRASEEKQARERYFLPLSLFAC